MFFFSVSFCVPYWSCCDISISPGGINIVHLILSCLVLTSIGKSDWSDRRLVQSPPFVQTLSTGSFPAGSWDKHFILYARFNFIHVNQQIFVHLTLWHLELNNISKVRGKTSTFCQQKGKKSKRNRPRFDPGVWVTCTINSLMSTWWVRVAIHAL